MGKSVKFIMINKNTKNIQFLCHLNTFKFICKTIQSEHLNTITPNQGAISLKLVGGKLAPKLLYFVLKKELLNFSETAPASSF